MITQVAALASGGVVGLVLGLIGGGGSILAVPLLLYAVGMPSPHVAIGTAAFAVAVNAAAGLALHARKAPIRWPCAIVFSLAGVGGAFAGADHPHVEGWGASSNAPTIAATEVAIAAAAPEAPSPKAQSNWSFLDGHVENAQFGSVYFDETRNRFDPFISGLFTRFAALQ